MALAAPAGRARRVRPTLNPALSAPAPLPPCPHRPTCPGCPRYGERGVAPEVSRRLAALAASASLPAPRVVLGPPAGFRHRARLAVRGRKASPKLGLFQAGSHRIADIPRCPIHHPIVNRVASAVREAVRRLGVEPYADRPHRGLLRYVQIAVERPTQRAQVALVANSIDPTSLAPLADALASQLGEALHSAWGNGNPERGNAILGPHWSRFCGPVALRERAGPVDVFIPPGAFAQSHATLADAWAERVATWLAPAHRVAELYAGCGALGLRLLASGASVAFNELSPHGLRGLELSLAARPPEERARARVFPGAAGERLEILDGADAVVVDPPRRGLDAPLRAALAAAPPPRLVYASCDLDSLLADAGALVAPGALRLRGLEAYDCFPYTGHVETLALFERV